ncbi:MAG: hypothetical protein NTU76_03130 [Candidatus Taylorbacteria bacterium]|nr:hypothetical protein [Candidatus Taylorbacteria bacterium]
MPKVRSIRYATRKLSQYKLKKSRLVSISRKAEIEELIKMGKMTPKEERRKK